MNTYVTSDLHFGHKNVIKYNPKFRPYKDHEEMDADMIRQWNAIVNPEDLVYILGDISFYKVEKTISILNQLNGNKILIVGNHDQHLLKSQEFKNCFQGVYDYKSIKWNNTKVCMMHYPISEWHDCHHGSVMLHGHLHGNQSGLCKYRIRDVGFDATGNIVTLLDDIVNDALKGKIRSHGWKNPTLSQKIVAFLKKCGIISL